MFAEYRYAMQAKYRCQAASFTKHPNYFILAEHSALWDKVPQHWTIPNIFISLQISINLSRGVTFFTGHCSSEATKKVVSKLLGWRTNPTVTMAKNGDLLPPQKHQLKMHPSIFLSICTMTITTTTTTLDAHVLCCAVSCVTSGRTTRHHIDIAVNFILLFLLMNGDCW
jgi:hypothetical protein